MAKKRINYICNQLGIKLRTFDPHPLRKEVSEYIVNSEDCAIRSICKITNTEYKDVYDSLFERSRKLYITSINYARIIVEELKEKYHFEVYRYESCKYKTLGEFMHSHKTGRFIISLDDHMISYINGTWYDSDDSLKYADLYLTRKILFIACEMKYSKYL